jgi:hypothetical protein
VYNRQPYVFGSTICIRIHHTKNNTIFSVILIREIKLNKEKKKLKKHFIFDAGLPNCEILNYYFEGWAAFHTSSQTESWINL